MNKAYIIKTLIFFVLWMWCGFTEIFFKYKLGYSNLGIIMALSMIGAFAIPYYMQNHKIEVSVNNGNK